MKLVDAGQFRLDEAPPEEPGMLMTSMIDIIFILLAFFVCVSEVKKGNLHVDVPEVADMEAPETAAEPLRIVITGKDEVHIDGVHAQGKSGLARLLQAKATRLGPRAAEVPIVIANDKEARAGTVMQVMGQASRFGFKKFRFAVEAGG